MTLGDRIVVMSKGHVMQIDTPMNLYDHPRNRFVAGFIGSPAMNFIDGTSTAGSPPKFVADGDAFTLDVPPSPAERIAGLENRAITLGIRPEDVSVAMESGPTLLCVEFTI